MNNSSKAYPISITRPLSKNHRHTSVTKNLWRCLGVSNFEGQSPQGYFGKLTKVKNDGIGRYPIWHTLRHTFASQLIMQNNSVTVVQNLLGHSSITTTMKYVHLAPSALRSAIDTLNPKTRILGTTWAPTETADLSESENILNLQR